MPAHRLGPLGEDDGRRRPVDHRDQHRGRHEIALGVLQHVALEQDRAAPAAALERLAEAVGEAHLDAIGKKAPPLHRPGGSPAARARSASS